MRAEARLTLDGAAAALFKTKSALHRMEKGETLVDVHLVKSMMDLYDRYDADILEETVRAREPGWWTALGVENQGYIDVETEAAEVLEVSLVLIPGLLQTADYARAVFERGELERTDEWLEKDVQVRHVRQERLINTENRLEFSAIIDEAALRKAVGGPEVMAGQLAHLRRVAELPNVTIQVLADAHGAHRAAVGGFTLLSFPDPADPPVLYVEHPFGAVHIEKEHVTIEARRTFEHLATRALSPDESVALIERISTE